MQRLLHRVGHRCGSWQSLKAALGNGAAGMLEQEQVVSPAAWCIPTVQLEQRRGIKKQANEVRQGQVLEADGRLLQVTKFAYTQGSGRQLGNVHLELRDLASGGKRQERRRPYDMVEVAHLHPRAMQVLYREGGQVHLMDPDSFEQETVDQDLFGPQAAYLSDGLQVSLLLHKGTPVSGEVPTSIKVMVKDVAATVKGDTVKQSHIGATTDTGLAISVPPYVKAGEEVVIDTRDGSFVRRAGAG